MVQESRFQLSLNAGFGYFWYLNNSLVYGKYRRVTGGRLAGNIGLGGVYQLLPNLGVSLNVQYVATNLKRIHIDYHDERTVVKFPFENRMGVARLNVSAGINLLF
jgi:hypothetical protein